MASKLYTASHPLRKREIRLLDLKLVPGDGGNDAICGSLRVTSLDDSPSYEALSYVWGTGTGTRQFPCGDDILTVGENCYDAMQHLFRNFNARTIWVDAICINQYTSTKLNDNDAKEAENEKARQIPLMRDIYWKATRVYIWLGKRSESGDSDDALEWLEDVSLGMSPLLGARFSAFPELMMPREIMKLLRALPYLTKTAMYYLNPNRKRPPCPHDAISGLIHRAWFSRMWTIQELVMANEPIVVCGTKAVSWNSFFWGIVSIENLSEFKNDTQFTQFFNSVVSAESLWLDHYKMSTSHAPVRKWLLPQNSTTSSSTRKKIISFLGWSIRTAYISIVPPQLLDCLEKHGWILAKFLCWVLGATIPLRLCMGLRPFNSPWIALLMWATATTIFLIPSEQNQDWAKGFKSNLVNVLNMIRSRQATMKEDKVYALYGMLQQFGVPLTTAAPKSEKSISEIYHGFTLDILRWSGSLDILMEASGPALIESFPTPSWVPDWSRPLHRVSARSWTATRQSSIRQPIPAGSKILSLDGVVVDTVNFCSDQLHGHEKHILRVLRQWIIHIRQLHPAKMQEGFERALFEVFNSETITEESLENLVTSDGCFTEWLSILSSDYLDQTPEVGIAFALSANISVLQYHREHFMAIAGNRIFFTTSKGYIGTGPPSMKVDDRVTLLSGFGLPMILRQAECDDQYQVVGAAYVHGMMQGEVWLLESARLKEIILI